MQETSMLLVYKHLVLFNRGSYPYIAQPEYIEEFFLDLYVIDTLWDSHRLLDLAQPR